MPFLTIYLEFLLRLFVVSHEWQILFILFNIIIHKLMCQTFLFLFQSGIKLSFLILKFLNFIYVTFFCFLYFVLNHTDLNSQFIFIVLYRHQWPTYFGRFVLVLVFNFIILFHHSFLLLRLLDQRSQFLVCF